MDLRSVVEQEQREELLLLGLLALMALTGGKARYPEVEGRESMGRARKVVTGPLNDQGREVGGGRVELTHPVTRLAVVVP